MAKPEAQKAKLEWAERGQVLGEGIVPSLGEGMFPSPSASGSWGAL